MTNRINPTAEELEETREEKKILREMEEGIG
jgi:hypothetical protein